MELASMVVFWTAALTLLYVLAGYSLVLLVLRGVVQPRKRGEITPTVTLIIPAHNEEAVIRQKLENSLAIDYPREKLEILVASDGSSDQTVPISRGFEAHGVRLLDFQNRRGKASIVNDAVAEATGDVLCLCDANVMFQPDAIRRLVGWLAEPKIGAATGTVRLASEESNFGHGESFYYRLERAIQSAESDVGSLMGVDGGMYVLRKNLFQPIPADSLLDDFTISMRVVKQGQCIVYDPDAMANESGTPHAMQEFRRRTRMAAGVVQVLRRGDFPFPRQPVYFWQFISHKFLRWMGPILLAALFITSILLYREGFIYQLALGLQLLVYAMAILGALIVRLRDRRLIAIPFYFVLGHVALAVGLVRGMFKLQKVTWTQAERGSASKGAAR